MYIYIYYTCIYIYIYTYVPLLISQMCRWCFAFKHCHLQWLYPTTRGVFCLLDVVSTCGFMRIFSGSNLVWCWFSKELKPMNLENCMSLGEPEILQCMFKFLSWFGYEKHTKVIKHGDGKNDVWNRWGFFPEPWAYQLSTYSNHMFFCGKIRAIPGINMPPVIN